MANKKLEVKNLQISFRTQEGILRAVRDINFDLYEGETLAIVGESGSGKSVTSKAIIGILAGNSIVEGGEILYDGYDLLKIDEEHFHKIRGDRISMIFQDPLSSLNPIMKIGQQLTEAMILNGKARQKNARNAFNKRLKDLEENLNEVDPRSSSFNVAQCKVFDDFARIAVKIETSYNLAHERAVALHSKIEELDFLVSKKQKVALKKEIKGFLEALPTTLHGYSVVKDERYDAVYNNFKALLGQKVISYEELHAACEPAIALLSEAIAKRPPDFFRLGYYKYKNPNFNELEYDVDTLNDMCLKYLNDDFMLNFIELGSKGMKHAREVSVERKKEIYKTLKETLEYVEAEGVNISHSVINGYLKIFKNGVPNAIDELAVHKHSVEQAFYTSISHEAEWFFNGKKNNPIVQAKYEKKMAKYNKLVEKGKQPTWKVIPPHIIDLELSVSNIKKILNGLMRRYEDAIENVANYDARENMIIMIDYMKELASRFTFEMTPALAKVRALELMKEVGIPEPRIRYNQYPFEFSGGMRQRIVIAIALSANPDILICDEPTTALDVTIQSQILELINKIKEERKLSVIFITHDLGVVANMADRIAVMYAGKIVEYGTSEDIFYDPRHPYTWALLSSTPDLDTKEKLDAIPGTPPNMIYPPKGDAFAERNKYAMDIDFEMEPPLFEISETHYAATWLLHPNAPKVEMPKIIQERISRMKKEAKKL